MTRVIVLLDYRDLRQWQGACLELLHSLSGCRIVGVVAPDHGVGGVKGSGALVKRIRALLLPPAMRRSTAPVWLGDVDVRTCSVVDAGFPERFADEDIDWMRSLGPDVVVRFGFGIIVGDVLDVAPNGVWSFHHGDLERYRGRPPAFWEILGGETRVGITLRRLTAKLDGGLTLGRAYAPIVPWSPRKTLQALYECGPCLLKRALLELDTQGRVCTEAPAALGHLYRNPRFVDIVRFGAKVAGNALRWVFEKACYDFNWRVGSVVLPSLYGDVELAPQWFEGPRNGFLADPGSLPGTEDTVLVEQFDRRKMKGVITALHGIRGDVPAVDTSVMLDLDRHLSFPQAYRVDGRVWLVPEMAAFGEQRAFELDATCHVRDPDDYRVIEGLHGVDPVLFFHDGLWWAFTSPGGASGGHLLNAFYAPDFLGPYEPHAANPIVVDPLGARPAGATVVRDGKLLRFGQVLGWRYGQGIDVFEITQLNTVTYREQRVARLRLKSGSGVGTHGIALYSWGAIVDGYTMRFSPTAGFRRLRGRLRCKWQRESSP